MTRQRRVILDELKRFPWHPTADEVYELVRMAMPKISLGTVYRNLERLTQQGLIRKLELAGSQKRFDATLDPHYHVRCTVCHSVEDVSLGAGNDLEERAQARSDYRITGHRLKFLGICPRCSSLQEDPS